jgi:hypothetical protein
MKSILMRLSAIEREYGLNRYAVETAVKEGRLKVYEGPLAKKWASYYRVDVEKLAAQQAKTAEKV